MVSASPMAAARTYRMNAPVTRGGFHRRPGVAMLKRLRPILRPGVQRQEQLEQTLALLREAVAVLAERDDVGLAQLREPGVQHGRRGAAALAQRAEAQAAPVAQLPDHAQRPAPPEQVEQRHAGAAGLRAANGL